ncbi:retropepsin-like aspartic protease [Niabella hibiscisoli]|uniref:retropepsin-like aspartic protease n=1 Tax=Niabella hibiscisoli TaxID=1825928 RepID=UPI001F0F6002|nr:retropepsin-like aspartic protease [Niabella hibiscisoli]MCH5719802.1 retroviral-like aspartic protease family protein [Niabella hibiscisoli]
MIKKIFLGINLLFLGVAVQAQEAELKARIEKVSAAFLMHTDSLMRPFLAKDFSVGAYMGRAALKNLNAVLSNYKLNTLVYDRLQQKDSTWLVSAKGHNTDSFVTHFYFNKNLELRHFDIADQLYGMNRNTESRKVATIPFESRNGSIILTVTLNKSQRPLKLLFDTGADGMMIHKALADTLGLVVSHQQQASVVGGNIDITISRNNTVHLNGFAIDQQSIAIFGNRESGTDGIIGNTIAKRYITYVDYDRKEITLYTFGKFNDFQNGERVPVDVSSGNMQMDAILSVQKEKPIDAKFILDTGAGYDLIVFRPLVLKHKLLVDGFKADSSGATVSMGISTPVFYGKASQLKLLPGLTVNNLPVTLMGSGSSAASWRPGTDGSLGIRFISRYNFVINLMEKYVAFVPLKKS